LPGSKPSKKALASQAKSPTDPPLSESTSDRVEAARPIGTTAERESKQKTSASADSNRNKRSVADSKAVDNDNPDNKVAGNTEVDDKVVDDGDRREELPNPRNYSPDSPTGAGGERTRCYGAKLSPRGNLSRYNSSAAADCGAAMRNVISAVKVSGSHFVNDVIKRGKKVDGISPVEKGHRNLCYC
jgi:hypothetical protein